MAEAETVAFGVPVHAISASTGENLDVLDRYLSANRTVALLGLSGAGKSTLMNRLVGEQRLRVQDVRDDGRGRHTTTHRELIPLPGGGVLVDTPGMRAVSIWDGDGGAVWSRRSRTCTSWPAGAASPIAGTSRSRDAP